MAGKTADELFADAPSADELFDAAPGEAGAPGHDPYKPGETEKQRAQSNTKRTGDAKDAAISWANRAVLGGGPQVSGAMGALANAATQGFQDQPTSDLDAYRDVRDASAKQIEQSADTLMGDVGGAVGTMSTPGLPAVAKGATGPQRLLQAGKVGGTVGGLNAALTSKVDLTKPTSEGLLQFAKDVGGGVGAGTGGGLLVGGALAATANPVRALAEQQALRAAGLRGGIKNSLRKDLGIANMEEARELGRQFLDEGLIPPVGSAEAVAARAEKLQGQSGNAVGSTLASADVTSKLGFDYPAFGDAARAPILDPSKTTAVARARSGKAMELADLLDAQGADTPGSFVGANRAKSDAWKAANFDADPDLSAVNYRKAVSGARQNIEDQVERVLGPDAAADLAEANRRYGVGADALKLAENAGTRDAAKKGLGMPEILALTTGAGTGAGSMAGHPVAGGVGGLGLALGAKAFDKYGHSSAARFADFLANRSGGGVGGQAGAEGYEEYLDPEPWKVLQGR